MIFMRDLIGGWAEDHSLARLVGSYVLANKKKEIDRIIYGMLAYWLFEQSNISLATLVSEGCIFFHT